MLILPDRALEAPIIRRLFSSSPRDPRYHMLSHLSTKFNRPTKIEKHEKRAALFLNRYTRTLTIMHATNGLADVLGITGDELRGQSFYYCIQENCLRDAVRCLEQAKANDSIAYLRFWYRDPREDHQNEHWQNGRQSDGDDMEDERSSDEDTDMGVAQSNGDAKEHVRRFREQRSSLDSQPVSSSSSTNEVPDVYHAGYPHLPQHESAESGTSSSSSGNPFSHENVWGEPYHRQSSTSSYSNSPETDRRASGHSPLQSPRGPRREPIELEAVISCTSDGLVACLRRARPAFSQSSPTSGPLYTNGIYAVPWATEPLLPVHNQQQTSDFGTAPTFHQPQPRLQPQSQTASIAMTKQHDDWMESIRECAVFAWALAGINGHLASYGAGVPCGEAQPPSGLPIWRPEAMQAGPSSNVASGYENDLADGIMDGIHNIGPEHQMRNAEHIHPFGQQGMMTGQFAYPSHDVTGGRMDGYKTSKSVYR